MAGGEPAPGTLPRHCGPGPRSRGAGTGLRPAVRRPFTHRHAQGRWTGLGWRLKPEPGGLGSQQAPCGLGHWLGGHERPWCPCCQLSEGLRPSCSSLGLSFPHGQLDGPCCAARRVEMGRVRGRLGSGSRSGWDGQRQRPARGLWVLGQARSRTRGGQPRCTLAGPRCSRERGPVRGHSGLPFEDLRHRRGPADQALPLRDRGQVAAPGQRVDG